MFSFANQDSNSVLDVYLSAEQAHFTPYKMNGLQHSYHVSGGLDWFDEYLVAGPTPTLGLLFPVKHGTAEPDSVRRFLEVLEARYDEVFAVEVALKMRLEAPIGNFDHALVLSPLVANLFNKRLTRRQLFKALPIYDCEFVGNESVAQAEASHARTRLHPNLDMEPEAASGRGHTRGGALELALPTGETHALTPKEVLDRLAAFVRTG